MGMCKSILCHGRSIKPCKTMLCCVKLVSETNTLKWFYTTIEECLISFFGGWSGAGCSKFQNYFVDGVSKVSELLCQWVNQMAHCKRNSNQQMSFWICTTTTVNPLCNHAPGDHFFCDTNEL
jgi:hypothetical protein